MVKYIPIIKQYIAREDVINTIAFYREDPDGVDHALQSIMNIPAADVQPVKHGKWIPRILPLNKAGNECSACLAISVGAMKPYYCPNCGATMDGAE